jgi:hypothetical protein
MNSSAYQRAIGMVAVRGLMRSMHSNFGFEPRNAMLVDTDLTTAGYSGERLFALLHSLFGKQPRTIQANRYG